MKQHPPYKILLVSMRKYTIGFNMEENTIDFNMDYTKDMNIQHLLDINNRIILHKDNMDYEHYQWTLKVYIGLITK